MEFSEVYRQFDRQEEENLKFKRYMETRLNRENLTFYESLMIRWGLSPVSFSLLFGLLLFLLHVFSSMADPGVDVNTLIEDFSFFLSLLNAVALYLLFSATEKLKEFLTNLIQLTKSGETGNATSLFIQIYRRDFIGKRTVIIGLVFGIINSLLAYLFGITYLENGQYFLTATFLLQVFSIGFIGGVTISGTAVVVKLIRNISAKDDINLAYFYPDKCAGTLIIGNILFLFSIHFIIIGVMIFLFIQNYQWTNKDDYFIKALILFWQLFPFLLSGLIFFLPVRRINNILKEYKLFEQMRIRKRINYLNSLIMTFEPNKEDSKERIEILDSHLQKLIQIDQQIGELNTWPYNLRYRATFLSIFLPVLIGMILQLTSEFFSSMFTD